jgi:2-phospho-L-lactate guanylyltransferase
MRSDAARCLERSLSTKTETLVPVVHAEGKGYDDRQEQTAVVVPIRAFLAGKSRLSNLSPGERGRLLRRTARTVVGAAGDLTVAVVSGAPDVRAWAASLGLVVLDDPGTLNEAAAIGVRWAAELGAVRVVIAHADLPRARSLLGLTRDGDRPVVTAVPCHRDDGTPVLSVPTSAGFRFAYGQGSFRRHAAEARRLAVGFRVVRDRALAYDVDIPDDLTLLPRAPARWARHPSFRPLTARHVEAAVSSDSTDPWETRS